MYRHRDTDLRYLSVTSLLGHYKPEFPREHWLKVGALKKILTKEVYAKCKADWEKEGKHILQEDYTVYLESRLVTDLQVQAYADTVDALADQWETAKDIASEHGSATHAVMEKEVYDKEELPSPVTGQLLPVFQKDMIPGKNMQIHEDMSKLEDGVYPELLVHIDFPEPVFYEEWDCEIGGIAGQADLVFIEEGTCIVRDYKTNKTLQTFPIKYKNLGSRFWKFPVMLTPETTFNTYQYQLSAYALLLAFYGFSPALLEIIHMPSDKKGKKTMKCEYMPDDVLSMLRYFYYTHSGDQNWLYSFSS